jgi:pyruvate, water dikinase
MSALSYVRRFDEIGNADVASVGGKNASIGEMYRRLTDQGVNVPNGFAVTADGYRHVLDEAGAWPELAAAFKGLHHDDVTDLGTRAALAREVVLSAGLPDDLAAEVLASYRRLEEQYGAGVSVAVAAVPRPRTCPTPASPASTTASSTSPGRTSCWRPCAAASPASSPTAGCTTGTVTATTSSRSPCPSA